MNTLRKKDGLAGFLKREESEYDLFGAGHSSTSISAALGMALAARHRSDPHRTVAVIGDGAITAGMAYEAMGHAGHTRADLLIILNDNQMSISKNIGGIHNYLARIWASKMYTGMRAGGEKIFAKLPQAVNLARRAEEHIKGMVSPGTLFEEIGFNYIGPINGHDLNILIPTLRNIYRLPGPQFLHLLTVKGKGFPDAEEDPIKYHAISKVGVAPAKRLKYQDVFGAWLCDMAEQDERLFGLTPAMCEGSGMVEFSKKFPDRFFDVAIAEQHCVTFSAGLACAGFKPVVAIYSTFLQRAYDQLIHDVALQNLDVLFALDRAGLVGEDGPTHAGAFDISYLRPIPNMVVMTPADENETRLLLTTGYDYAGPAAVRYPRGSGPGVNITPQLEKVVLGRGRVIRQGKRVAILNFGALLATAQKVAEKLDATLMDMRFVKPLDTTLIDTVTDNHQLLVTLEDNVVSGGAGSAVNEWLFAHKKSVQMLNLGLPDRFIEHATRYEQLASCHLTPESIEATIKWRL